MEAFDAAKKKMKRNTRKIEVIGKVEDFLAKRTCKNEEIVEKFKRYLEIVPAVGIPWTEEALDRLKRLPDFACNMIKTTVEEEAKKQKQVVISPYFLDQVLRELLPKAMGSMGIGMQENELADPGKLELTLPWDAKPLERVRHIPLAPIRQRIISRVENYAMSQGANRVTAAIFSAARSSDKTT